MDLGTNDPTGQRESVVGQTVGVTGKTPGQTRIGRQPADPTASDVNSQSKHTSHQQDLDPIAELDFDRYRRRGYPEAIYCAGKTPLQCAQIAAEWKQRYASSPDGAAELGWVIFTKADDARAQAVLTELPDALYDPEAGFLAWPPTPPAPTGGLVVVACAGTSDLPIAREAALTCRYLGREVTELVDVGVAGLERILSKRDILSRAAAIVVVAGMEGALASVTAGLVSAPVVAVPTSVGYGSAFAGITALLSMLNSCAPGVAVVNIDNGYGGGHLASQISAPKREDS